jgi:hypothetical protein
MDWLRDCCQVEPGILGALGVQRASLGDLIKGTNDKAAKK